MRLLGSRPLGIEALQMDGGMLIEEDDASEDDQEVLRDDDSLSVCIPEKVHDVKLGDSAKQLLQDNLFLALVKKQLQLEVQKLLNSEVEALLVQGDTPNLWRRRCGPIAHVYSDL